MFEIDLDVAANVWEFSCWFAIDTVPDALLLAESDGGGAPIVMVVLLVVLS